MSLTREQVKHIAHLARLTLTDEDLERYRQQLSSILDYMAQLGELDTAGVPPFLGAGEAVLPLRPDEPGESLPPETLLGGAPDVAHGQFRVPPVFDEPADD
ncbi:MAG: Asp-tRNA(Asn)/Glu-tRNA(Gln) amidotransferase subunit GatC [Chloroflexi bacterium]|nr:Asp-tRNA(Asn)/Glu-tRNA(Gln) amidotransferase subunit GatC [Chloroflexota bacterium]